MSEVYITIYKPVRAIRQAMRRLGVRPGKRRPRDRSTAALCFLWLGRADVAPSHINFRGVGNQTTELLKLTWTLARELMSPEDFVQVRKDAWRWANRSSPPAAWKPMEKRSVQ